MRLKLRFVYLFCCLISACSEQVTIKMAVDASILHPIQTVVHAFEETYSKTVHIHAAPSHMLTKQIKEGDTFDILISPHHTYLDQLNKADLIQRPPQDLALGNWIFWTKKPLEVNSISEAISYPQIQTIALPNPSHSAVGQAARNWMQFEALWDSVQRKLAYHPDVQRVNEAIVNGSVDAAFTFMGLYNIRTYN